MAMKIIYLVFDQIPAGTGNQKKFGKGFVYESANAKTARKIYREGLKAYAPETPFEGAISLEIEFSYFIKDKKKKGKLKTSRPDLDNVAKLFIDEMMHVGYFKDDSQIVSLHLSKRYSDDDNAEIKVTIKEIDYDEV